MRHNALYLKCIFINPQEEKNECCNLGLSYLCKGEAIKASVQFSSAAQLCLTLCDPMNCSTSGLPVGEGNGTPLQYSCLPNPMEGGAW